jgi:CDP-diacylglycerol--serine O-phosphatidyltransferase
MEPQQQPHIIHPFPDPSSHDAGHHGNQAKPVLSIAKLIPNCLTLSALIAAVTSVQFAVNGKFESAVIMLLLSAILDLLDGAVARALKAQSEFGAQLDSLSDFLAFGVAPSILLYEWALGDAGKLGWIATIVLPVAAALRLARFNVMTKETDITPAWKKKFFTGVPTPAGAGLVMLPIYIWFISPDTFTVFSFATPLIAVWTILISMMMISRLPTFSFKGLEMPQRFMLPTMGAFALTIAALIHAPWFTLTAIMSIYLASMPFIYNSYRKHEKRNSATREDFSSLAFGISLPHKKDKDDDQDEFI